MNDRIGVVGLGVMGSAMSKNIMGAGHAVLGFDIDPEKLANFVSSGGVPARAVGEVAAGSDLLLMSLPTVDALAQVAEEIARNAHEGLVCLEAGTFPLEAKMAARETLAAAGVELLDTPLSGTGLQAADATLVVYASGNREGIEKAGPIFEAIGRSTHDVGEFGNGSKTKYIANLLVVAHSLAAAEAHELGLAAGLDPTMMQRVVADGVGSSKMFEIRGPMMVADDYPPAARLDIHLKDAKIIASYAQSVGAVTPLLDTTLRVYEQASAAGLGDLDAAALCRYLEGLAGIER